MPLHLALLGVGSPVASAFVPTDLGATLKIWGRADGTLWQDSARTTPVTANNDPVGAADDAMRCGGPSPIDFSHVAPGPTALPRRQGPHFQLQWETH